MPMTSPVERISGPSSVSTLRPCFVRKRLNGMTASLTAIGMPRQRAAPSPVGRSMPVARSSAIEEPSMMSVAALASWVFVAFETNGTVREARGFASMT